MVGLIPDKMLLFFILFIFFMLHLQFLLQNIFFGVSEGQFFNFSIHYKFDTLVSEQALLFVLMCAIAFAAGYLLFNFKRSYAKPFWVNENRYRTATMIACAMGLIQIFSGIYQIISSGFSYQLMAESKMDAGLLFEMRIFYLLPLSYVFLNIPLFQLWKSKKMKAFRWVFILYIVIALFEQARSTVFEVAFVFLFSYMMWHGDKIKLKYVFLVFSLLIVPNIIVLGRLGFPDNIEELIDGLFSFEYSILFNNLLGAAIVSNVHIQGLTFLPSLALIIPSPLRHLLGINVVKSDYYEVLSSAGGVSNGGFSLLAELFSNFGWYSPLLFLGIGLLLGKLISKSARVGEVSFIASVAPLIYVAFILAFRNDLGVFLKYSIQTLLMVFFLKYVIYFKPNSDRNLIDFKVGLLSGVKE